MYLSVNQPSNEYLYKLIKEEYNHSEKMYNLWLKSLYWGHFDSFAMECFKIIAYTIALSRRYIKKLGFDYNVNNKELVNILEQNKIITPKEAMVFSHAINFRTKIEKEYHNMSSNDLKELYETLPILLKIAKKLLNK